jgi:hypothetical protein
MAFYYRINTNLNIRSSYDNINININILSADYPLSTMDSGSHITDDIELWPADLAQMLENYAEHYMNSRHVEYDAAMVAPLVARISAHYGTPEFAWAFATGREFCDSLCAFMDISPAMNADDKLHLLLIATLYVTYNVRPAQTTRIISDDPLVAPSIIYTDGDNLIKFLRYMKDLPLDVDVGDYYSDFIDQNDAMYFIKAPSADSIFNKPGEYSAQTYRENAEIAAEENINSWFNVIAAHAQGRIQRGNAEDDVVMTLDEVDAIMRAPETPVNIFAEYITRMSKLVHLDYRALFADRAPEFVAAVLHAMPEQFDLSAIDMLNVIMHNDEYMRDQNLQHAVEEMISRIKYQMHRCLFKAGYDMFAKLVADFEITKSLNI